MSWVSRIALALLIAGCSGDITGGVDDEPGSPDAGAALPDGDPAAPDAGAAVDAAPGAPDAEVAAGGVMFLLPWQADVAYRVTQAHNGGSHTGNGAWAWDFGLAAGTPLLATHNGVVRRVKGDSTIGGCDSAYASDGNYVVLDRGDGLETLYLHMQTVTVTEGQTVTRGDVIGTSGQTGWACGAHLHFQIQRSPDGGGGATWYNPSVQEFFHDTGAPLDPPYNSMPVSKNGVLDIPGPPPTAHAGHHPHGGSGATWDQVMRETAE